MAEARWYTEELALGLALPHDSPGAAEAVRFLLPRFPPQLTPSIGRATRLKAHAFLDEHWPAVRRLVEVLCARPLRVTLPGPVVTRLIETTRVR